LKNGKPPISAVFDHRPPVFSAETSSAMCVGVQVKKLDRKKIIWGSSVVKPPCAEGKFCGKESEKILASDPTRGPQLFNAETSSTTAGKNSFKKWWRSAC